MNAKNEVVAVVNGKKKTKRRMELRNLTKGQRLKLGQLARA